MFATYKKKGYAGSHSYPVGNDPTDPNNGKFAGVYYEVNNAGERVTLIGAAEASADCRANGSTDTAYGVLGRYEPCIAITTLAYQPAVTFEMNDKQGYWFGLMKYYQNGSTKIAYDREYSKKHYAIVAFPADYGSSGESTFIMNEEGTVYYQDMGEGEYIDTYPGPDPTQHGWEIDQ